MTDLRQAAQQALEALENMCDAQSNPDRRSFPTIHDFGKSRLACIAIKEALEQQQAELNDEADTLTIVYQQGFADGKRSAERKPFDVLVITTAYEQGVGKGHQAHGRGVEIENPYAPGEGQQAWALGYDEGKKQAAPKVPHNIKEGI